MEKKVMSREEAKAWLLETASRLVKDYKNDEYTIQEICDMVEDLLHDYHLIDLSIWKTVIIKECEFAPSQITVEEGVAE